MKAHLPLYPCKKKDRQTASMFFEKHYVVARAVRADQPAPPVQQHNVFQKTWKLFVGPSFYKDTTEGVPSFPCQDVQLRLQDQTAIDTWYSETDSAKGCIIFF